MKNLIRKILQESTDEFNWAEDIISNEPNLPISKPDNKTYLLFLSKNSNIEMIINQLKENGWVVGRYVSVASVEQKMIQDLSSWTKEHLVSKPYIYLNRNSQMSYGSSLDVFTRVHGQEEYVDAIKINL